MPDKKQMGTRIGFVIWLAASLSVESQQPNVPVKIGASGVAPLRYATYVQPVYPQIALSARVPGEIVVEATVVEDGTLRDIRVLRSVPLLDQAVIDAVRQWRFAPPQVGGVSAPVRVPISASFLLNGSSRSLPVSEVQSPKLPRDFAIIFASNCEDGSKVEFNTATSVFERNLGVVTVRVDLVTDAPVLESLQDLIVSTGLMAGPTPLVQWPAEELQPEISPSGIRLVVRGEPAFVDVSDGPPLRQFFVDLRMNGTWTRLYPPASWPYMYSRNQLDTRDRERERNALQIRRLLEKHVQSYEVVRKLPRTQQWCRLPD
jgi:TonB family protein